MNWTTTYKHIALTYIRRCLPIMHSYYYLASIFSFAPLLLGFFLVRTFGQK